MHAAKLTLSIPKQVLKEAKSYSKKTRQPLSQLVSRYFSALSHPEISDKNIAPKTAQVTGLVKASEQKDKDVLLEALLEKYK